MRNLIIKDFLTISRDRSEVLILLAMPLILIMILGFALGGLMQGEVSIPKVPIALVVEQNFEAEIEQFELGLVQTGLQETAVQELVTSARTMDPATILSELLSNLELDGVITLSIEYEQSLAEQALKNDEVAAVITIPEQFSYATLMAYFLDEVPQATIELLVQDHEQIRASVIDNILTSFVEQYNLELSILQATGGTGTTISTNSFGEITYLETQKSVSAFQYYTMGMAVMFALYVASTISSNAFKEKTSHVYARIMLSGERPLRYLLSKGISATVLTAGQLAILFVVSSVIFRTFSGISFESFIGMIIATLMFSITIGSLATLLTAIVLQFNDDAISGIFSGILVSAFAFMGGSMLPVEQFSPFLRELGNWTPNGAMMTAYLQLLQGFNLGDILPMLYRVLGMAVLFITLGVAIVPKRRLM